MYEGIFWLIVFTILGYLFIGRKSKKSKKSTQRKTRKAQPEAQVILPNDKKMKKKSTRAEIRNCPVCKTSLNVPYDKSTVLETYPYREDCQLYANCICFFCKSPLAAIIYKDTGHLKLREIKWDEYNHKYFKKENELTQRMIKFEENIAVKNEQLNTPGLTETQKENVKKALTRLHEQIDKIQDQYDRLEERYENWHEKHDDRQERWREKAMDKIQADLNRTVK